LQPALQPALTLAQDLSNPVNCVSLDAGEDCRAAAQQAILRLILNVQY
jgi:hypothetical protein